MTKPKTKKHAEQQDPSALETVDGITKSVFGKLTPEKMVNRALEKTDIKSETVSGAIDLKNEVQANTEKSWVGKITNAALGGLAALTGREIFKGKEKKAVSQTAAAAVDIYGDEKKLETTLDTFEELESEKKRLEKEVKETREKHAQEIQIETPNLSKKEALKKADERIETLEKTYGGKDKTVFSIFGNAWNKTATDKDGQSQSWFGRAWAFIPALIKEYGIFSLAKKMEKDGVFEARIKAKQKAEEFNTRKNELKNEANRIKDDAKKFGNKAKEKVNQAKTVRHAARRSGALPALKLLKANNEVATKYTKSAETLINAFEKGKISPAEFAKSISTQYKNSFGKLLQNLETGKIKPQKFADLSEALLKDTQTLAGKNKEVQNAFLKLVKNGEVPGMKINKSVGKLSRIPAGAVGVASAINISLIEAIEAGSFSKFFSSLTSAQTLKEAFVPGVGTWNSIKRTQNTDNPTWLKAVDVGINVVGDIALTAGYVGSIFSFGTSAGAGMAVRGGIASFGRRLVSKQSLKFATQAAKQSVKKGVRSSVMMSPFSAGIALLAKKIKGKEVEKHSTEFYKENIETKQQKRARGIVKRLNQEAKEKKEQEMAEAA